MCPCERARADEDPKATRRFGGTRPAVPLMSHFDGVVKAEVSWRWVWGEREETGINKYGQPFGGVWMQNDEKKKTKQTGR